MVRSLRLTEALTPTASTRPVPAAFQERGIHPLTDEGQIQARGQVLHERPCANVYRVTIRRLADCMSNGQTGTKGVRAIIGTIVAGYRNITIVGMAPTGVAGDSTDS